MKVGDYVRISNGQIAKIIKIKEYIKCSNIIYTDIAIDMHEDRSCNDNFIDEDEIIKSSPNIIDLIQAGDYINGLRVEKNKYGELYTCYVYFGGDIGRQCEVYDIWLKEYKENEDWVETIVTKEQFESMKYRIGE